MAAKTTVKPTAAKSQVKHPSYGVTCSVVELDQTAALELLAKSKEAITNRTLSYHKVNNYKDMMLAGQWALNGETIILDVNGNLINGQHRLQAIVEAGNVKPGFKQPMLIAEGVNTEAMQTIDLGWSRTVRHAAKISGREATALDLAIAKFLYFNIDTQAKDLHVINPQQILATYDEYKEHIEFASRRFGGSRSIAFASYRSIIARAHILGCNEERLEQFMCVVDTGYYEDNKDISAVAFRNYVIANRTYHNFSTGQGLYQRAMWAISTFLKEKPTKTIGSLKTQQFPIEFFDNALNTIKRVGE